jgi:hypothetical protein
MLSAMLQFEVPRADGTIVARVHHLLVRTAMVATGVFLVALLVVSPAAIGQALPAAEAAPISTGFSLPRTAGTLNYAVSASESILWGYSGRAGTSSSTNLTGDLAYLSSSRRHPFSAVFSGGRSWSTSDGPSYSFLNLGMSQVLNAGRWNMVISDSVSYLPGTPSVGLSGVAGIGDLGVNPNPGPIQVGIDTGQGILTNDSSQVGNTASGNLQRQITGKTSISGAGSYSILRFLDGTGNPLNSGLDTATASGGGGFSHQANARNSWGGNFLYSSYNYSGDTLGIPVQDFSSQTASLQYSHRFTRKLYVTLAGGPQWSKVGSSGGSQTVSLYANVMGTYTGRYSHVSLAFTRGTDSGYGVVGGALSDSVSASAGRTFAMVWSAAVTAAYSRNTSLPSQLTNPFVFNTTVGSVQVSRAIVRNLSVYASYTAENQTSTYSAQAVDVFNGITQVLGFGLTYSPSSIHLGRQ